MINHGANTWRLNRKYGLEQDSDKAIVDFSANINPYGPPVEIINVLQEAVQNSQLIADYPEEQAETLRDGIAASLGIGSENVVVGNGSVELLYSIPMMLQKKRNLQKAVALTPNFSEYENVYSRCGIDVELMQALSEDTAKDALGQKKEQKDVVIIGNPNNPCGYLIPKKDLLDSIVKRSSRTWVIDEAFIEFTDVGQTASLAKDAVQRDNLIVVRSMTKIYGLAGLRLGYAVASAEVAKDLQGFMNPWRINTLAVTAGLSALTTNGFAVDSVRILRQQSLHMFERIQNIKHLEPFKPQANFILIHINSESKMTAEELQRLMLVKGFAIRDCSSFTGLDTYYFRIAVKRPEDNSRLIEALEDVFM